MSTGYLVPVLSILLLMSTFIVAEGHQSNRHRKNEHHQDHSHADFSKEVKEHAKAAIDDLKNRIDEFRNEIRDHFSSENDNENWHSKLKKLIKEHIENFVSSLIKEKLDDASSSFTSDSESSSRELVHQKDKDDKKIVHQKDKGDKSGDSDKEKCDDGDGEEASDTKDGKSINKEGEELDEGDSIIQDITELAKNVKSKIIKKILADKKYIKAHLHKKLSMLEEALRELAASNDDDDDDENNDDEDNISSSDEDDAEKITLKDIINKFCDNLNKTHHLNGSHFYQEILHTIWERFGSEIEKLNTTRQEFLQAKEEMIEAAKELHDYDQNMEVTKSRLQLLVAYKYKLQQMILKKKQYLKERSELREKIRPAFNDIFGYKNKNEGYPTTPNDVDVYGNGHGAFQTGETNYEFTRHSPDVSSEDGEEIQITQDPRTHAESEKIHGTEDPRTNAESEKIHGTDNPRTNAESEKIKETEDPRTNAESEKIKGTEDPRTNAESEKIKGTEDPRTNAESEKIKGTEDPRTNAESEKIKGTEDPGSNVKSEEIQETNAQRTTAKSDDPKIIQKYGNATTEQTEEYGSLSGNSSLYSGINLAAGYRASGFDVDDGGDSSAVVVLIVIACLVATAGVVILGTVMWKRQRRHRLYAKIPSRHELL